MSLLFEQAVPDPKDWILRDPEAELIGWQGRKALRLSGAGSGPMLLPTLLLDRGKIEVDAGAEGTAFPGIVFRASDPQNFELAYAQPHTSGLWDALQYDPVFHGSNTWQLHFGDGVQKSARVPANAWFRLRVELCERRALIQVDDQPPLLVEPLAHDVSKGRIGLWTYKPACFSNFRLWDDTPGLLSADFPASPPIPTPGTVDGWFLDGFGALRCEPGGILILNRYLPASTREVRLVRRLEMPDAGTLTVHVGFSDELLLQVDEREVFSGHNTWKDTSERADRGYASLDYRVEIQLSRGFHTITAHLKASEYFGFGMAARIEGSPHKLLPVELY